MSIKRHSGLSPAAQMVFETYYRDPSLSKSLSNHHIDDPEIQQTMSPTVPFATIRALAHAPFIPTYRIDASFLQSGEDFFEENILIAASLKPSTRHKYAIALEGFRHSPIAAEEVPMSLDHRLAIYIQERYLEDSRPGQRQEMANLICMLTIMYPSLRGQLGIARRCINGWKNLKPSQTAAPFTKELAYALVWHMLNTGRKQSASLLMLTFGGGFRVSEIQKLSWKNVAMPGDIRLAAYAPGTAGMNIKDAKTFRTTGKLQFVNLQDREAVRYLRALYNATPTTEGNLICISLQTYNHHISEAAKAYGLEGHPFSSHSARVGRAILDFINGKDVKQIAIELRWQSINSLRHYIINGRAWILDTPITPENQAKIASDAQKLKKLIADLPEPPYAMSLPPLP